MSCQVTHRDFIFFGEFRGNDTCVFDRRLLTKPVSLSIRVKSFDLEIGDCTNQTRPHSNKAYPRTTKVILLRCTKARIHCVGTNIPRGCQGFIQRGKKTYLCDEFQSRNKSLWTGICREVRNFNIFKNEFWFDAKEIKDDGLYSNIGAASIRGKDTRMMKVFQGEKEITQILKLWFLLCAAKVAVVFALACAVMYAVFRNAPCLVNDERSLVRLLEASVPRLSQREKEESALYLHSTEIDRETVFWASGYQLRKRFNQEIHVAEWAAM